MKAGRTAKVVGVAVVGVACVAATSMFAFAGTQDTPEAPNVPAPSTARTLRISVSTAGDQADKASYLGPYGAVSDGGRFVTFISAATNLVPGDTNGDVDVFVRDTQAGTTVRVSTGPGGVQADSSSNHPTISADGRYVAFDSSATNLVPDDTNASTDIFVRDLVAGTTTRASVADDEAQSAGRSSYSTAPSISPDGRHVTFVSRADNLVPGDTNGAGDVFVRDLDDLTTVRVNVSSKGKQDSGEPMCELRCAPRISNLGRYVSFSSYAADLVPGDTNGEQDVFVRDLTAGTTVRANVSTESAQAVNAKYFAGRSATITADGRYVFFASDAPSLVYGDSNGTSDMFQRDLVNGTTTLIKPLDGKEAIFGQVGTGGRYLGFGSHSADVAGVPGDTNGWRDAYVRDLVTGVSTPVSVSSDGAQGNGTSSDALLSPDGRAAAFESEATNLVEGDTNGVQDVFLRELGTAEPAESVAGPKGTYSISAKALWPGQSLTLDQLVFTGGADVERLVYWGDNSAPQPLAAGATTATHVYPKSGGYAVRVVLLDKAGNRTGVVFDGASWVTVSAPVGSFLVDRSSIWASQPALLHFYGVTGVSKVSVAWGDGATSTPAPTATTAAHTYSRPGTYEVAVTVFDENGAGTLSGMGSVVVTRDTFQPVVTVKTPTNPAAASSWAKVAGTANDKGLGVVLVRLSAVQKRGTDWFSYTGTSWAKAASETVALQRAAQLPVAVHAGGGWSRPLQGVTKGTLKVVYSGVDRAGNAAPKKTLTQTVTG